MRRELQVAYAGSLAGLLADLLPQFEARTGYRVQGRAGGSRETAQALRAGGAQADVFLSADAQVNERELMGEENGGLVEWYLTFAANEMVLAYTPCSPGLQKVAAALTARAPLLKVLRSGFRLCRADPEADPKGYRAIMAIELLAEYLQVPKLRREALGEPRDPAQLVAPAEMMGALARGEYELALTYRNQAVETETPFVALPDAANLGEPACAEHYAGVSYQCEDGTTYRGGLISYTAAMLTHSKDPVAAAALVAFLASGEARALCERHGFRGLASYVRGAG